MRVHCDGEAWWQEHEAAGHTASDATEMNTGTQHVFTSSAQDIRPWDGQLHNWTRFFRLGEDSLETTSQTCPEVCLPGVSCRPSALVIINNDGLRNSNNLLLKLILNHNLESVSNQCFLKYYLGDLNLPREIPFEVCYSHNWQADGSLRV